MKTLADFKRALKPGLKIHTVHRRTLKGYDTDNRPIFGDYDMGIREVAEVRATNFSFWTKDKKTGELKQSYCDFPKASQISFEGNTATILEDFYGKGVLEPILTYKFLD